MEKANKIKSLEGIQRVRFNDFSEYESEKSANGGSYGFWTDYTCLENGRWEASAHRAEFDFCPVCGSFDDHRLEDGTYECGEFQTVSEEELIEEINKFVETDDEFIEYKGEK
jgi:hypothetical protein